MPPILAAARPQGVPGGVCPSRDGHILLWLPADSALASARATVVGWPWGCAHSGGHHDLLCVPSRPLKWSSPEISICRSELKHTLNRLGAWMKDEHVEKNWVRGSGWPGMRAMGGRGPSHHPSLCRQRSWTRPSSARTRTGWCSSSGPGTTPLTSSWCPSSGPSLLVRLGCVPAMLGGNLTGGCPVSRLGWEWDDGGGAVLGAGLRLPKSEVLTRSKLLSCR